MSKHPRDACPRCGGSKGVEAALCAACERGAGHNDTPVAAYVCPYADEMRGPRFYAHRQFCPSCPDVRRIPDLCDDWHCEECAAPCPCHTPPTPGRIAAHDAYWATHVMNRHDVLQEEMRGGPVIGAEPERQSERRRVRREGRRHPCQMCGAEVSECATLCRKCAARLREASRRAIMQEALA